MATSLYKGQIPFRIKGGSVCIYHKGNQLDLYCEKCEQLACIKCLSSVHKSHPLCGIGDISARKKQDIQNFIKKSENTELVQIDQYIMSTDKLLMENASNFGNLSQRLMSQTNKLKEDLDFLSAQTLSLYKQMEEDNAKLLQTYKHDLEMYSTQLKQKVLECKEALQRGSNIDIFDTGCEIHSSVTLPVKPTLGTVSFTPNGSPQCHLKHALGEMDVSDQGQGQSFKGHDRAGQKGQFIQQQRSGPNVKTPSTQQRSAGRRKGPRTKILGELESPCNIDCICPGTEGRMWTSAHNSDTMIQLDKQGKIVQEVKHNAKIKDISLSPTTNILWACDEEKYITELVSGRLVQRFKNTEEPQCICITASKHVVLGAPKHIKKFTANGELVLSTMAAGIGKAYTPHRISECPVTHNIAVVNLSDGKHVGKNQQVIVMDTDFKELFRYGSEDLDTHQPKAQSEVFDPWNVAYDSGGRLVIGDRKNKRVLLISGRGEFLRNLHRDVYWTTAVGIDREDILWVMFGSCNIKLLKYST